MRRSVRNRGSHLDNFGLLSITLCQYIKDVSRQQEYRSRLKLVTVSHGTFRTIECFPISSHCRAARSPRSDDVCFPLTPRNMASFGFPYLDELPVRSYFCIKVTDIHRNIPHFLNRVCCMSCGNIIFMDICIKSFTVCCLIILPIYRSWF